MGMDKEAHREMLIARLVGHDVQELRNVFVNEDYSLLIGILRKGHAGYDSLSTSLLEDAARHKGLIQ